MDDLFAAADNQGANVLTVTQLSNQLRFAVEKQFSRVVIEGEISGLKRAASGHMYFTLKDDDSIINAIVWRGGVSRIKAPFEDGLYVVAYGKVTTYGKSSNYQIIIDRMEPAGIGALMQRFEDLKKQLEAEGLFAPERKKQLPFLPNTIGVITSPTGAVIDDMLNRLKARFPSHVLLWPVAVQGVGAKEQIAAAIKGFNSLEVGGKIPQPDVIIVARGGGSLEDLWPFNEEIVVRAVANSDTPIISGVGHEPDITLCDYAADHRSPTPTAAATEAIPDRIELQQKTSNALATLAYLTRQKIKHDTQELKALKRGFPDPKSVINQWYLRLDDRHTRLHQASVGRLRLLQQRFANLQNRLRPDLLQRFFSLNKQRVNEWDKRLSHAINRQISHHQRHLDSRSQLLQHLSPKAPLAKGFVYVADTNGNLIKSATTSAKDIVLHFNDGERTAKLD